MTKARDLANAADVLDDVSATELSYVNGVTSAIQTQLNAKQATVANVNDTEIGYLDGVTSAIQTQLDAKVAKSLVDAKGDLLVGSANDTVSRLAVASTAGYVLTVDSAEATGLKWAVAPVPGFTSIADGTLATGVSTTTISNLGGYDTYLILLYNTVTTADNKTYNITMNNTSSYYGIGGRLDAYSDGSSPSGTGEGFRLEVSNYVGTQTDAHHAVLIQGGKSSGSKIFQYFFFSDYLDNNGQTYGWTNSTAALSSITITSNGTLNGGTYRILAA